MAQLVNKYLDEIDILKIKMENDADKILEVIDIDELLKNPSLYLQELGRAFLDEHQQRGLCICGLNDCKESYVHWTSGC